MLSGENFFLMLNFAQIEAVLQKPINKHFVDRIPVIVSFEGKASKVERAIGLLVTRLQKPFFFLLPAASTITSAAQDIASRNNAKLFAFEDIVEISDKGILQSRSGIDATIKGCSSHWVDSIRCTSQP